MQQQISSLPPQPVCISLTSMVSELWAEAEEEPANTCTTSAPLWEGSGSPIGSTPRYYQRLLSSLCRASAWPWSSSKPAALLRSTKTQVFATTSRVSKKEFSSCSPWARKKKPLNCLVPWPELLQLHHLGQPQPPRLFTVSFGLYGFLCVFRFCSKTLLNKKIVEP